MAAAHSPPPDRNLLLSLALMRLSIAGFLMVWVCDKLFNADAAVRTFSKYYYGVSGDTIMLTIGLVQLVLVLTFAAGRFKTITYGTVTLMHAVSTIASYERYMDPLARPNILFWAAIPVLAAMIALFILRERDQMWTLGSD